MRIQWQLFCDIKKFVELYYRDEVNDGANENNDDYSVNNEKTVTSKSFEHKTKIVGGTPNNNIRLNGEVFVSLKYLSSFWRTFGLALINCEIKLGLSWSKDSVISEIPRNPNPDANLPVLAAAETLTTKVTFQVNNANLYVLIVTLSINDNIKFLENNTRI